MKAWPSVIPGAPTMKEQIPWSGDDKVYSLVLDQCTMVLLDKIKQDAEQVVSDSYDPLKLLKLIEKSSLINLIISIRLASSWSN